MQSSNFSSVHCVFLSVITSKGQVALLNTRVSPTKTLSEQRDEYTQVTGTSQVFYVRDFVFLWTPYLHTRSRTERLEDFEKFFALGAYC